MSDIENHQAQLRAGIHKSGIIWGGIAGVIVGGLAYWLGGGLDTLLRAAIAALAAGGVGYASYRGIFNSGAKQALCESCGTAFSVKESSRSERLVSSEPKSKVEEVAPAAGDKSSAKLAKPAKTLTKWIEETYDVTVISTCAQCQNTSSRVIRQTREKDKQTVTK